MREFSLRAMNGMKASFSLKLLSFGVSALLMLSACGNNSDANGEPPVADAAGGEFALSALSRGKGVPEPTREALENAIAFLEEARQRGDVMSLKRTRIGLEGETRICVQAKDATVARELRREVQSIAGDVELFNIVEEPCSKK